MLHILRTYIPETSVLRKAYSWSKAVLANLIYQNPSKHLVIIGITGTDGKTTTSHFTAELLQLLGVKVAMASTEEIWIGSNKQNNTTKRTTLSPFFIQKFLQKAHKESCKAVILEISSHALSQGRVLGIDFNIAAITNISQEHGNYHGDLKDYAKIKAKLFQYVAQTKKEKSLLIANKNMQFFDLFSQIKPDITQTFSLSSEKRSITKNDTDFIATILEVHNSKSIFSLYSQGKKTEAICLNIPGSYNIENALIAIQIALFFNISLDTIIKKIPELNSIAGRLQKIPNLPSSIEVYIDFAVTPGALEKVLTSLKQSNTGKIFIVFGATGKNHDHAKRPLMGKVTSTHADFVVLTEDETYGEDNDKIMKEVASGFDKKKKNFTIIPDREKAIHYALANAKKNDIIVISGMGNFNTRNNGEQEIPWSDTECVHKFFKYT
jgi:UDP-N-acetylmuramoyl-L-alanyl-D-glutamate--2,6-diaminopimelate ligase